MPLGDHAQMDVRRVTGIRPRSRPLEPEPPALVRDHGAAAGAPIDVSLARLPELDARARERLAVGREHDAGEHVAGADLRAERWCTARERAAAVVQGRRAASSGRRHGRKRRRDGDQTHDAEEREAPHAAQSREVRHRAATGGIRDVAGDGLHSACGTPGAQGGHRPLRRSRRLHRASRDPRPRGRRGDSQSLPRALEDRARVARRLGGEVHRRRGDGALRRSGLARGRPGARGPLGVGDPSRRPRVRLRGAHRGEHRRGARVARRRPAGRRSDGRRRRRQHSRSASGRRADERHPGRGGDASRHAGRHRLPRPGARGGEREVGAGTGLDGDRGALAVRRRRPPARRGAPRRPAARARPPAGGIRPRSRRALARARDARRCPRDRQEPARLGALPGRSTGVRS